MTTSEDITLPPSPPPQQAFAERCLVALRSHGLRITAPRQRLISFLASTETPYTPAEVYELLERSSSIEHVDRVTVYRVLETLESLGVIHRSQQGKYFRCDSHSDQHHEHTADESTHSPHMHFFAHCHQCGDTQVGSIPNEVVVALQNALTHQSFNLTQPVVELQGSCKACEEGKKVE